MPRKAKSNGSSRDSSASFSFEAKLWFAADSRSVAEKGWRDAPFHRPVVRDQAIVAAAIYTAETID